MRIVPSLLGGSRHRAGEWVVVRSREEILATLDENGCLDGLPFQPEMLRLCGQRQQVFRSAHKSCDYSTGSSDGRRMGPVVHLEGGRCDGSAHDGCQAHCLLFWRDEWLAPADAPAVRGTPPKPPALDVDALQRATRRTPGATPADTVYRCQTTELRRASSPLAWWDVRQYIDDVSSRNHAVRDVVWMLASGALRRLMGLGFGYRVLRAIHDRLQAGRGRPPAGAYVGPIPPGAPTPTGRLDLQPGEQVETRNWPEVEATLNRRGFNRGMRFDFEMVKFLGQRHRVEARIERIIDERTSMMVTMKEPCIQLEGVHCMGECTTNRLGCPRRGRVFWREIWIRRVADPAR